METVSADFEKLFLQCMKTAEHKPDITDVFMEHIRTQTAKNKAVTIVHGPKPPIIYSLPSLRPGLACFMVYLLIPLILSCIYIPLFVPESLEVVKEYTHNTPCLIDNNIFVMEMARPVFNCDICKEVDRVPIIRDLTQEEFVKKYAYSGVPVLVKDATKNWTAMKTFTYKYFQDQYQRADEKHIQEQANIPAEYKNPDPEEPLPNHACQFFPYNTDLNDIREAMNMSDDRASYEPGEEPWYFGWSNCNPDVQAELRTHYQRPYFLPSDSETSSLDWMFMGGNGRGAPIHLDSVSRPSWQAQISGSKTWTLVPPPECEAVCTAMNITVQQGDILVIDTNMWYHATYVHPGPLSITIGSEYD